MQKTANILLTLVLVIIVAGCFRKEKTDKPKNLIPPNQMAELLTDLYLADGLFNSPQIRRLFNDKDSNLNYLDIIDSHHLTKSQIDLNIEYYFISKPKKFEEIYDIVLANLSAMQAENMQQKEVRDRAFSNLWNEKSSYSMPDDGINNPITFKIPLQGAGEYILKARATSYGDDQTLDPRATLYFWKDDGTEEGVRDHWDLYHYNKNGRSELITLSKYLYDTTFTHLSGWLYNYTSQPGHWEMHARISSIILTLKESVTDEEPDSP